MVFLVFWDQVCCVTLNTLPNLSTPGTFHPCKIKGPSELSEL